jgi:uncharacterized protein DUF5666
MRRIILPLLLFLSSTLVLAQQNESAPPNRPADGQQSGERRGPRLGGTITAIASDSITLKTFEGRTATVHVTDATRYRKDRNEVKLSDFKVGDTVLVRGEQKGEDDWNAVAIVSRTGGMGQGGPPSEMLGKKFIAGEIKSIDGLKLTILRPDGQTQTIAVDENTSFRKQRESITLADFYAGDRVFGRGEVKDGVFVAATLNLGEPPTFQPNGPGPAPDRH